MIKERDKQKYYKKTEGQFTLSGSTIMVTGTPLDGDPKILAYDPSTPSPEMARDIAQTLAWHLEPVYIETVTETIERSKGLGRGITLGAGFKELGELKFELKPTKEIRTTQKVIWPKPQQ